METELVSKCVVLKAEHKQYRAPQRTQGPCHGKGPDCLWPQVPFSILSLLVNTEGKKAYQMRGQLRWALMDPQRGGWRQEMDSLSSLMAWYLGQESKFLPYSTGKQRLMRLYYLTPQQRTGGDLSPQHLWDTWMLIHRAVPAGSFHYLSE